MNYLPPLQFDDFGEANGYSKLDERLYGGLNEGFDTRLARRAREAPSRER